MSYTEAKWARDRRLVESLHPGAGDVITTAYPPIVVANGAPRPYVEPYDEPPEPGWGPGIVVGAELLFAPWDD